MSSMNSKRDIIFIILIVIFSAVCAYLLFANFYGNYLLNKMSGMLMTGKIEEFERMEKDKKTKRFIKPFNLDYIVTNKYMFIDDIKQVRKSIEKFENVNLNNKQKVAIYQRLYYYFLSKGDDIYTKKCYSKLNEISSFNGKKKIDITYNTYIENGYKYEEEVLVLLNKANENEKLEHVALLADIYQNKGDANKANEYKEIIKKAIQKQYV